MTNPAPTSKTTEIAISVAMNAFSVRCCRRLVPPRPAVSVRSCRRSTSLDRNAGRMPKITPVSAETTRAKTSTVPSRCTTSARGSATAAFARIARSPKYAMMSPNTPPASASRMLSVRSCRMRRSRSAPRAVRIATSRVRPAARASNRFATFAHAMSSTMPTAVSSSISAGRTRPVTIVAIGTAVRLRLFCSFGKSRESRSESGLRRAFEERESSPGFSRATT